MKSVCSIPTIATATFTISFLIAATAAIVCAVIFLTRGLLQLWAMYLIHTDPRISGIYRVCWGGSEGLHSSPGDAEEL